MKYNDLKFERGKKNLPGFKTVAYFIPKSQITSWPVLAEDPADALAASTYTGSFTLAAENVFTRVDIIQEKSSLSSETQGEKESPSVLNKLSVTHAGTEEEAVALQRFAIRDDLVWLVQDLGSASKYRVLGNAVFETKTKISINPGSAVTDAKATTIEVEVSDELLPFYTGTIMTADGDVNPPVV